MLSVAVDDFVHVEKDNSFGVHKKLLKHMDLGNIFYASVISIIRNANIDLMYAFNTTDYRGR